MSSLAARIALVAACAVALAGCAAADAGDPGDEPAGASSDAVSSATCAETDRSLFFHGMYGYGRELAVTDLCLPRIGDDASSGFWSEVAHVKAPASKVVGGYSAGRIPLLRRLAKGEAKETVAVMLDPSYSDGPRFAGKTGPSIVSAWLEADEGRRFVLVYSPTSTGWSEYAELARGPLATRVKVCKVKGAHVDLPRLVGSELLLDPAGWVERRCAD